MATIVLEGLTFREKRELIRNAERSLKQADELLARALERSRVVTVEEIEREVTGEHRGVGDRLRHRTDGDWEKF